MKKSAAVGDILTLKEVAGYLKVTERTIYRLAAAKKIPAFKVGGTWRFSRAEIEQWIKRQTAEPPIGVVGNDGDTDAD
ncbi:MAG: helix-turn-helix domain-containing protein [Rhodocyclales bacterium]|nr:helix-turn-helix domain-containing protein [Rhodocyclales bacterium]